MNAHLVSKGELYADENLTVSALHNNHLVNFEEKGKSSPFPIK